MSLLFMAMAMAGSPVEFTIDKQAVDGNQTYLHIQTGDVDGDGVADDAVLKLDCTGGSLTGAVISPREASSGMPTGKRQHAPIRITKEWEAASPSLRTSKGNYDLKKMEGARKMAVDDWQPVSLNGLPPGVCSPAQVVKSKSNITKN